MGESVGMSRHGESVAVNPVSFTGVIDGSGYPACAVKGRRVQAATAAGHYVKPGLIASMGNALTIQHEGGMSARHPRSFLNNV